MSSTFALPTAVTAQATFSSPVSGLTPYSLLLTSVSCGGALGTPAMCKYSLNRQRGGKPQACRQLGVKCYQNIYWKGATL